MNNPTVCTCCQKPLTGGLDTFGAIDCPMCWTCHSDLTFYEGDPSAMWNGLREAIALEFPEDEEDFDDYDYTEGDIGQDGII